MKKALILLSGAFGSAITTIVTEEITFISTTFILVIMSLSESTFLTGREK